MYSIKQQLAPDQAPSSDHAADQGQQATEEFITLSPECLRLIGGGEGASVV